MKNALHLLAAIAACLTGLAHAQTGALRNVEVRNGLWFDGTGFQPATFYSVGGVLALQRPANVDATLDLAGAFVVPPFAEAHNHNIGSGRSDDLDRQAIADYLAAGVFYVKVPGNLPLDAEAKRRLGVNRRDGVDVLFAQGSLTGPGGHPAGLVAAMLRQGLFAGHSEATLHNHRYFTIAAASDVESKWPAITALQPDFIKAFLVFSEEFERRANDPAYFGQRGLDPRLLPAIVAKAHGERLRVTAHVETAADFRGALEAGVDEIAHVPRVDTLTDADARLAAQRGTVVITTVGSLGNPSRPPEEIARERAARMRNFELLLRHGVKLVVGSDNATDTSVNEAAALLATGAVDELALLRMWTGATARAIFPERRIGALAEGYEASFVALEGNPLQSWDNVRRIRLRFKQGAVLPARSDRP